MKTPALFVHFLCYRSAIIRYSLQSVKEGHKIFCGILVMWTDKWGLYVYINGVIVLHNV